MIWLEWVIKIGGAITAVGVIWATVTTAVEATVKKFLSELIEKVDGIEKHTYENYLSGLRLTIMSSDMPLGERIVAADKYLGAGGNGDVKRFAIEELHIKDINHND